MNKLLFINALLWFPLAAASLHIFEEFVLPGGFSKWYQNYRGSTKTVNWKFLVIINVALLLALGLAAIAGPAERTVALLLTLSAVLFSNGCWHLWASYKSHSYAPGVITGILLYVPLGICEYVSWVRLGDASLGTAGIALLIGGLYPLWSALYHNRSKRDRLPA